MLLLACAAAVASVGGQSSALQARMEALLPANAFNGTELLGDDSRIACFLRRLLDKRQPVIRVAVVRQSLPKVHA